MPVINSAILIPSRLWLRVLSLLLSLFGALMTPCMAHPLDLTSVMITIEDGATVVTVIAHLPSLAGAKPEVAIPQRLRLQLDDAPFRPSAVNVGYDPFYDTLIWRAREIRVPARITISAPLFPELPGETTLVTVRREGQLLEQAVLTPDSPSAIIGETTGAVFGRFVRMGIHHILSGADHVLFVLGLLLVGGTLRGLLVVVTAFTIAHSITVSMTALQFGTLPSWLVEPVIALSIVAVGMENLVRSKADYEVRIWIAFGFGFFHGFGFAGALTAVGLPQHAIPWALAAFNLGVEIGQACIVALAVPLLQLLSATMPNTSGRVLRYASLGIATVGILWFVERLAGLG